MLMCQSLTQNKVKVSVDNHINAIGVIYKHFPIFSWQVLNSLILFFQKMRFSVTAVAKSKVRDFRRWIINYVRRRFFRSTWGPLSNNCVLFIRCSLVLVPGSNTEVAKQFFRCVLIKLAPHGVFSEVFRTVYKGIMLFWLAVLVIISNVLLITAHNATGMWSSSVGSSIYHVGHAQNV